MSHVTHVKLCSMTHVKLCSMTHVKLCSMTRVKLCSMTRVKLCSMTRVKLCSMTRVKLCSMTRVKLCSMTRVKLCSMIASKLLLGTSQMSVPMSSSGPIPSMRYGEPDCGCYCAGKDGRRSAGGKRGERLVSGCIQYLPRKSLTEESCGQAVPSKKGSVERHTRCIDFVEDPRFLSQRSLSYKPDCEKDGADIHPFFAPQFASLQQCALLQFALRMLPLETGGHGFFFRGKFQ